MATRFDNLVVDFYTVESMFQTLGSVKTRLLFPEPFMQDTDHYPHNINALRLYRSMENWRESHHPNMARMLRDSLLGMALGESRHATAWDRYQGDFQLDSDILLANKSRQDVYSKLSSFSIDDASIVEQLFNSCGWRESFGGASWAEIARYVQRYDELDATTFIDIVVHAVHNGGCAFDKGLLVVVSSASLVQSVLDRKFAGSTLELSYLKVSPKVKQWIKSYKHTMEGIGFPCTIPEQIEIHDGIQYNFINWATESNLNIVENPDRKNEYCSDCGFSPCECEDCNCEECQQSTIQPPELLEKLKLVPKTQGASKNVKKTKKQTQEYAKSHGLDFEFNPAQVGNPLSLR